jgi:CHAT domain-containing protein/Tfp pilus assembly protein PilF
MSFFFTRFRTMPFQLRIIHFVTPKPAVIVLFLIPCNFLFLFSGCVTQQDAYLATEPSSGLPMSAETADTHMERGTSFYRQGAFEKAISEWETAAELYQHETNIERQCKVRLKLSEAYQTIGQFEKAEESLEKAGELARNLDDQVQIASVSSQLGSLYLGVGRPDEALRHLNKGLGISRKIGKTDLTANILNNLGNFYASQQEYQEAIHAYEESITHANQDDDQALAVIGLINAAKAAIPNGQPAKARTLLQEASHKIQSLEDSHFKSSGMINIGLGYRDLESHLSEPEKQILIQAFQSFKEAALVAERIDDMRAYTYALGYLGRIYEDANQPQEALQLTRRAVHAAQKINMPEALFQWQWQEGRIFKSMGEIDGAIAACRSAISTLQSLRNEQTGCYDRFNSPIRKTVEDVSFDLVDLLLKRAARSDDSERHQEYLLEAREVVELRKVYELRNYFQDDCVDAARSGITRLEDVSKTAVVVYPIVLKDRIEVLASFPTGLKSFLVSVSADEVIDEVRKFRKMLEKRTTRQFIPPARKLYDWLIRPIESDLRSTSIGTLVFVPDGPLRTIPMAALHNGERFLIEDYAIATTPGLDLTDPEPIVKKSPRVLILALTQSTQGFPALPYVSDELQKIKTLFPSKLLLNEDFQVAEMETALRDQQYAILHIASHAQFENETAKTFIVAYDGNVSVDDLSRYIGLLQFREDPLELLTLSACETAAGDDKAALGLAGIAIKAGARSALASLWHINDFATSKLVEKFYRGLKDPAGSKAKSLQSAQLSLLNDSRFRHPGYWAPFILINNWL